MTGGGLDRKSRHDRMHQEGLNEMKDFTAKDKNFGQFMATFNPK